MARGRPARVDHSLLHQFLLKYRKLLYDEITKQVTSKRAAIWEQVSCELFDVVGIRKSASALYAHVTCKKIFFKDETDGDLQTVSTKNITVYFFK